MLLLVLPLLLGRNRKCCWWPPGASLFWVVRNEKISRLKNFLLWLYSAQAVCSWWGLLPGLPCVVVLSRPVVLCKQTSWLNRAGWKIPASGGGGLPKTVSLIRGCYTGFLCILLVDSLRKCSRGMEGGSPSFIGKVAVGKMCFLSVRVWAYHLMKLKYWFHVCEEKGGICTCLLWPSLNSGLCHIWNKTRKTPFSCNMNVA